jgi:MshEN domain
MPSRRRNWPPDPRGLRSDEDFFQRLAVHAKLPYVSLEPGPRGDPVDPDAATTIGAATARAYALIPIAFDGDALVVALSDPEDEEAVRVIRQLVRREVKPVIAAPGAVDRAQERVFGPRAEPGVRRRETERLEPPPASRAERRRAELLARYAGLEFVDLELRPDGTDPVDHGAARQLSAHVCRAYRLLAVATEIGRLVIAVDDPFDAERQRLVFALTGRYPRVTVASARELERAIARVFGRM